MGRRVVLDQLCLASPLYGSIQQRLRRIIVHHRVLVQNLLKF